MVGGMAEENLAVKEKTNNKKKRLKKNKKVKNKKVIVHVEEKE